MSTNRRDFIKYVVAGAVVSGCPVDLSLMAASTAPAVDGEHNEICHQVRDLHHFDRSAPSARHEIVIVGGGISGLTSSYLLRDRDFLLLEKEPHWGGNSYLEEFQGSTFATGGAFTEGEIAKGFAKEIGLDLLPIDNWDGSILKGEFIPDTWGEGLDHLPYSAKVRDSFKKFRDNILAIDVKKRWRELDSTPFSKFCRGFAPEVKQWWDGYGPSNWGAPTDETSALLAIGELQGIAGKDRKDERFTLPGGLGAITRRLAEILAPHNDRMQTGATIVAVSPQKHEVHVTYIQEKKAITVAAKAVIMAAPKMITARLVEGLPAQQKEAMQSVRYIPYPVVNLMFDKPVFNRGYDTWCPGNRFTDFIVADWTIRNQPGYKQKYNILTCYTPLAEDERGWLLTEPGCKKIASEVLRDFRKLMPGFDVDPLEVHIYRRGHPLYMSLPGNFTKTLPLTRSPLDRVFFANTDSEGPESTTAQAIKAAQRAVKELTQRLAGPPQKSAPAVVGF